MKPQESETGWHSLLLKLWGKKARKTTAFSVNYHLWLQEKKEKKEERGKHEACCSVTSTTWELHFPAHGLILYIVKSVTRVLLDLSGFKIEFIGIAPKRHHWNCKSMARDSSGNPCIDWSMSLSRYLSPIKSTDLNMYFKLRTCFVGSWPLAIIWDIKFYLLCN